MSDRGSSSDMQRTVCSRFLCFSHPTVLPIRFIFSSAQRFEHCIRSNIGRNVFRLDRRSHAPKLLIALISNQDSPCPVRLGRQFQAMKRSILWTLTLALILAYVSSATPVDGDSPGEIASSIKPPLADEKSRDESIRSVERSEAGPCDGIPNIFDRCKSTSLLPFARPGRLYHCVWFLTVPLFRLNCRSGNVNIVEGCK